MTIFGHLQDVQVRHLQAFRLQVMQRRTLLANVEPVNHTGHDLWARTYGLGRDAMPQWQWSLSLACRSERQCGIRSGQIWLLDGMQLKKKCKGEKDS